MTKTQLIGAINDLLVAGQKRTALQLRNLLIDIVNNVLCPDDNGNVGIGANSPSQKLQVDGSVYLSAGNGTGVSFASNLSAHYLKYDVALDGIKLNGYAGIVFETLSTERMRIDASGNVGIGTTTPGTKLNIYTGSATSTIFRAQNTNGYADFGTIGDGTIYGPYATPAASTSLVIGTTNSNPVLVYTNGSERARIDASGNVGIGTTSPTEKLDIDSNAIRLRTAKTPASATATGTQGQVCWDSNYVYVCVATNTWKRAALSTW